MCTGGCAYMGIDRLADFIKQSGGNKHHEKYNNCPSERDMSLSIGNAQKINDFSVFGEYIRNNGKSVVFVGHTLSKKE